jgi:malate dehydrogenase
LHIAQIGTGCVGRPTAYTIMCSGLADTLTVCDVKLGLAAAFAEELKHVTSSIGIDVEINSCEKDEEVTNADIILVSAGEPRLPGVKMSRRDLAVQNAKIVKHVSETTAPISTGTNLESLRFRSKLAETLNLPKSQIRGWVGGEHGEAAIPLWSTTQIQNQSIEDYIALENRSLNKNEIDTYIKNVSRIIIDNIGGTEYGPAASFRDITRAIVKNTGEILSVATPIRFRENAEPIFVGIPVHLGWNIGMSLYETLSKKEQEAITEASKKIYQTYLTAIENLE